MSNNICGNDIVTGDLVLFDSNHASTVMALYGSSSDWEGVGIALSSSQNDIFLVTGVKPMLYTDITTLPSIVLIAGTIGKNPVIDNLIACGNLDVSTIEGKWESYLLQVVETPCANVERALVIAGSDKRGTIYGIYEFSRMIGVSPWVWWGDSTPERREKISFPLDLQIIKGEPSVKYRGFFLNDESPSLSGWFGKHFPKVANPEASQGCGSQFYVKVFELLLRLKGNYLWPVMWNNSFHTDDEQNTILADRYGVVMGTSHHEHMTCADKEWNWSKLGDWNYATNRDKVYDFWKRGLSARKDYEAILTLGMRGQCDTSILGANATLKDNMELMQKVLADQREIIKDVFGKADTAPQMIALYKEVEDFYYGDEVIGKLDVPDDVTLMLCDDNFGNVRTLPTEEMRKRSGGFGMYYHFDYRGGPISYQWINQTPLPKVWDNMTRAYDAGIKDIWIVNVGDLKPMELPLDYFLSLAYDYEKWSKPNLTSEFIREWASREFGDETADVVAGIISRHTKILGTRKAEVVHANPSTFSLTAFNEANRIIRDFEAVVTQSETVYESLSEVKRAAFFQMVLYPARAAMNVYKFNVYAAWNEYWAKKGAVVANGYARLAEAAWQKDKEDMEYYNQTLSQGKWDGIMRQNHLRYTTWDGPKTFVLEEEMPSLMRVDENGSGEETLLINTYLETQGFVSINPSRFVSNSKTPDGEWVIIEDYGREQDSVKLLPNTATFADLNSSPSLEYSFLLQTAGEYVVNVFILPINNPYHFTVKLLDEQLRFAVQVDDGEVKELSTIPKALDVGGGGDWADGVMNNTRVIAVPQGNLSAGLHRLRIIAVDAGMAIQKIVITSPDKKQMNITDRPPTAHFMDSYLGPPESDYHY
ncbi:MAG: glycosyl hydrolase 115 family protein [Lachnospiraceae bacterium]|jgi:hypothetical protein|nr:glycosyl hydrolase 115 family protein [Lachnospiraceae bacterium]